eukprot:COSAG06_NODE_4036_length_4638_cov_6.313505_4_plen_69_part_00
MLLRRHTRGTSWTSSKGTRAFCIKEYAVLLVSELRLMERDIISHCSWDRSLGFTQMIETAAVKGAHES